MPLFKYLFLVREIGAVWVLFRCCTGFEAMDIYDVQAYLGTQGNYIYVSIQ